MIQEGWIGLLQSAESYDQDKGVKYSTFAYYRTEGQILSALRSDAQTKMAEYGYGKNTQFESIEKKAHLLKELEELSERDRKILEMYAEGYTQEEIAGEVEISQQGVSFVIGELSTGKNSVS